jgi:hypothetical protein
MFASAVATEPNLNPWRIELIGKLAHLVNQEEAKVFQTYPVDR